MTKRRTLREKIGERIARRRDDVFLTREFRDLGGEESTDSFTEAVAAEVARRLPPRPRHQPLPQLKPEPVG